MSRREYLLAAVATRLAAITPRPTVERNADAPVAVGATGHIVLRDGEALEPDVALGAGPSYWHTQLAQLEVYVDGDAADLDALLGRIEASLVADRTLGGLAQYVELRLDELMIVTSEGAVSLQAALVAVAIEYETTTPLG